MHLVCKQCDKPISEKDINLVRAIARCRYCRAVNRISSGDVAIMLEAQEEEAEENASFEPSWSSLSDIQPPANYTVEENEDGLTITRKWWDPTVFKLSPGLMMMLALSFFAFVLYAFYKQAGPALLSLIFLPVWMFFLYFVLSKIRNQTEFHLERGTLRVRHTPFWWPGNHTLTVDNLDQLFCQEQVIPQIVRVNGIVSSSAEITYGLYAILDGRLEGRHFITIASGFNNPDEVLYLEHKIEDYLGIQDRPVAGELPKS